MDLADWRHRIDELDAKILELLNERAHCVIELAPLKERSGIPVYEPEREAAVHEKLRQQNRGPLSHKSVGRIFDALMVEMRELQKRLREEAAPGRRPGGGSKDE